MSEEILNETTEETIETVQRVNPFCVISKNTFAVIDINGKEHKCHEVQTNASWGSNPYGDTYAVVPDDMVTEILATKGFCDIELNEDGTEVVSFTALEIPEIPEQEAEPTLEEKYAELESQLAMQAEVLDYLLMQ